MPENIDSTETPGWVWPSNEEINDFPDPLGFEDEWRHWKADMANGPSVFAEIFAREHLQNSWDSIQEQLSKLRARDEDDPHKHGVNYRFVRLTGEDAIAFASRFGIDQHASRLARMTDRHRRDNRLNDSVVMGGQTASIDLLVASEMCGEGMGGPWRTGGKAGVISRLKSALMQTKSDKTNQAAGGSWGHGKKAIANASRCRTIGVYTRFEPHDGVSTRFLGVSYWRSHDLDDRAHVGLGLLGSSTNEEGDSFADSFDPLEDDHADQLVHDLGISGLDIRSGSDVTDLGVTYLIVEPVFGPEDLASALERNWWPLFEKGLTTVTVTDYEGAEVELSPRERPELAPFIQAAELALGRREPRDRGDDVHQIRLAGKAVGTLALTSDDGEEGWSYADPDTNWTLVALIRNDMVTAYENFPTRRQRGPYLRGALIVDRENNGEASELLKMAEPHLHNVWKAKPGPSVPKDAANFANKTLRAIQARVSKLRSSLKEDDVTIATHFPVFSQIFAEGRSPTVTPPPPPPPPPPRSFHITGASGRHLEPDAEDPTRIRVESTVQLSLTEKQLAVAPQLEVLVKLGWRVLEESGAVRDETLLDGASVEAPEGFTRVEGGLRGWLTAEPQPFTWASAFFPDDWRVAPDPQVDAVDIDREDDAA